MKYKNIYNPVFLTRVMLGATLLVVALGVLWAAPRSAFAAVDTGIPEKYEAPIYNALPHVQFRNVLETETVDVSGIKVEVDRFSTFEDKVHFRIFNSTTQETEYEVDTIDSVLDGLELPAMKLKKNHDYTIFVEDPWYQLGTKSYIQVLDGTTAAATEGPGAYDYKHNEDGTVNNGLSYSKLKSIKVYRRDSQCADPFDDNRYNTDVVDSRFPLYIYYKGAKLTEPVKFKLVSDLETIEATTSDAKLKVRLIEDVTYMVYVESNKYTVNSFPLVVKDKSEYGEGRYCYNHSTCNRVSRIDLYDKGTTTFDQGLDVLDPKFEVRSLKGRAKVTGMDFKHILLIDRVVDTKLNALNGKDYQVMDLVAVNPHRWEISKLLGANFTIKYEIPAGKDVAHVYRLENGQLKDVTFKQLSESDEVIGFDGKVVKEDTVVNGKTKKVSVKQTFNRVQFATDSISLHKYVIEYKPSVADATFGKIADAVYTGSAIKPGVSVSYKGAVLKEGTDYTLTYSNNVKTGNATVKVSGKGAFGGLKTLTFKIIPKRITPALSLGKSSYTYSGKTVTPSVVVQDGTNTLNQDVYTISFGNERKKVGTYTVSVDLKDPYIGSSFVEFTINPKGTTLKKLTAGKKRATVTWKKQAKQTTGYQIQYSTNKKFKKGTKTLTVKGAKKTKATIKKLKSGKRYYMKIRTYKKVGKTTYYSTWSKAKSIKVK